MVTPDFLRIVIFIAVNSGGVGKTFLAEMIDAIARLLSLQINLASYDRGNHALVKSLGPDRVSRIVPPADIVKGREIVAKRFRGDILVSDTGANALVGEGSATQLAQGYCVEAEKQKIRVLGLMPAASAKIGGLESALRAIANLEALGMPCRLVLNDLSGSSEYGDDEVADDITIDKIPHLPAGYQALRLNSGQPLFELITDPQPGYELAAKFIYAWLFEAAKTGLFQEIFGSHLKRLAAPEVGLHDPAVVVQTLQDTKDSCLAPNCAIRIEMNAMHRQDAGEDYQVAAFKRYLAARQQYLDGA